MVAFGVEAEGGMTDPVEGIFEVTYDDPPKPNPRFGAMLAAMQLIDEKHGGGVPAEDITGTMPCTLCKKGTLHYGVSSYNGHRRGQCTTPDCLNWIE